MYDLSMTRYRNLSKDHVKLDRWFNKATDINKFRKHINKSGESQQPKAHVLSCVKNLWYVIMTFKEKYE